MPASPAPRAEKLSSEVVETEELAPLLVQAKVQDGTHVAPHVTLSGSASTTLMDGDTPLGDRVRLRGASAIQGERGRMSLIGNLKLREIGERHKDREEERDRQTDREGANDEFARQSATK